MSARKPAVHSAWTDPDGLTPCCGHDPRTVGPLTQDDDAVTCTAAEAVPEAHEGPAPKADPKDTGKG